MGREVSRNKGRKERMKGGRDRAGGREEVRKEEK
jgi:hypothetical protein